MSPTNNQQQIILPLVSTGQRQADTISLERVRKHHNGGTETKDSVPGFIARNSASASQFLLDDTTTCKISSLWWPSKVWAGLLKAAPAANGTLSMQAAFTICQSLEIHLHQPHRHKKISVFSREYQEGDKLRVSEVCHYLLFTINCKLHADPMHPRGH